MIDAQHSVHVGYHVDEHINGTLGLTCLTSMKSEVGARPDACDDDWVREVAAALDGTSDTPVPATNRLSRFIRPSSPQALLGRELGAALASKLPVNLQDQFASAAAFDEGDNPMRWARRTSCLFDLIVNPLRALAELDRQERRTV